MNSLSAIKNVIVIGAGFGGLAIANRLRSRGLQVTVLEKNRHAGGHAYPFERDGFRFDMGPSLITAPEIINRVFKLAGRDWTEYLQLQRLDPYYRIYFHDRTFLDYTFDSERMKAQMARFNARDAANYDRFMEVSRRLYEAVIVQGLGSRPFMDWRTMFSFLPAGIRLGAFWPAFYFAGRYFRDFRHRFAFSFHPLFIGGSPFRAPAVYQMIPYLEKSEGVWYSRGGMYSLVEALTRLLAEQGGTLRTNAEVKEIIVRDGRAAGVQLQGETLEADLVISNADFLHTYGDLIPARQRKKWNDRRLQRVDYSMSAFLLYLGLDRQYPQLQHHTLMLSHRYRGLVRDIFDRKKLSDDFSMYLHAPTRSDAGMAPAGCESLYVLAPVPNLRGGQHWDKEAGPFADRVLRHLEEHFGLQDLRRHIRVKEIFTPEDFRKKQNAWYGSAWGVEPRLTQTAVFRPHNRSEDLAGLYLVGASTHPGAGLPGVFLTAETTEHVMLEDIKKGMYG